MVDELKKIKRELGLPEYLIEDMPEITSKNQLAKLLGGRFTGSTLVVKINKFWVIEIFGWWKRSKRPKDLTLEIYNTSRGYGNADIFITYGNLPTLEEAYMTASSMANIFENNFEDWSKSDAFILHSTYEYNKETGECDDITNPMFWGTDTSTFDWNISEETKLLLEESKQLREETKQLLKEGLNG